MNCGLKTQKNNDFHVNLVDDSEGNEFEGIVAEMPPQDRPEGWTLKKLRQVRDGGRKVLIRGLLFYDNVHDSAAPTRRERQLSSSRSGSSITDRKQRKDNKCSPDNLNSWKVLNTLTLDALGPFSQSEIGRIVG